jgi:hypothetical protein
MALCIKKSQHSIRPPATPQQRSALVVIRKTTAFQTDFALAKVATIFYHSKAAQTPNGPPRVLILVTVNEPFFMLPRPALTHIRHRWYICELRLPLSTSSCWWQRAHLLLWSRPRPNIVLQKRWLLYRLDGPNNTPTVANLHQPQLVQHRLEPKLDHCDHNNVKHKPANISNKYPEVFKYTFYWSGSWDSYRSRAHWCSPLCRFPTSAFT